MMNERGAGWSQLRWFNSAMAVVHTAQGAAILALSSGVTDADAGVATGKSISGGFGGAVL